MHIMGMAKSNLNLKSGQAIRLELDFFKLAFAVAAFRADGQQAQGYFQVLSAGSVKRVKGWCEKYETGDAIVVLEPPALTAEQQSGLEAEKKGNAIGIVSGDLPSQEIVNPSIALLGRKIGEDALAQAIKKKHPTVEREQEFNKKKFPHGINWDFYGIAK